MTKYTLTNSDHINFWLKHKHVNIINYEIHILHLRIFPFSIHAVKIEHLALQCTLLSIDTNV